METRKNEAEGGKDFCSLSEPEEFPVHSLSQNQRPSLESSLCADAHFQVSGCAEAGDPEGKG